MSSTAEKGASSEVGAEDEEQIAFSVPPPKSLSDIMKTDAEDESLNKYKDVLIGQALDPAAAPADDPRRVIVIKLIITPTNHKPIELDLTQPKEVLKKTVIRLKEGEEFRFVVSFLVHHDIVYGLRCQHQLVFHGIKVAKPDYMVGSYSPRVEPHVFAPRLPEKAPEGLFQRGKYNVHSKFCDDDGNTYLEWEWIMSVGKSWDTSDE